MKALSYLFDCFTGKQGRHAGPCCCKKQAVSQSKVMDRLGPKSGSKMVRGGTSTLKHGVNFSLWNHFVQVVKDL